MSQPHSFLISSLFLDEVACADPEKCFQICGSRAGCTNIAFPKLVLGIMPEGNVYRFLSTHAITLFGCRLRSLVSLFSVRIL